MNIRKIGKAAVHLLLLLILYILQTDVFTHLRIGSSCPLLLPIAAAGFGIFESGLEGGLWGLAAGILCDISCGSSVFFTVMLTFTGFISGVLSEYVLARGFPSFFAVSAAALLLTSFFRALPVFFSGRVQVSALAITSCVQFLYSIVFALPVYWSIRAASRMKDR